MHPETARSGNRGSTPFGFESVGNGYMRPVNGDDPKTKETGAGAAGADGDVETDPAKDTETGSDWTDEGGATPDGPSTDTDE